MWKKENSIIIECPNSARFNEIALFCFAVNLGWSTYVEAKIQNLPWRNN